MRSSGDGGRGTGGVWRRLTTTQWLFDGTLALGTFALAVLFIGTTNNAIAEIVVAAVTSAGVALRRASPPIALGVVALGAVLQMATLSVPGTVNLGQLFVIYACAAFGSKLMRRVSLVVAVVGGLVGAAYLIVYTSSMTVDPIDVNELIAASALMSGFTLAVLVCAWLLGLARHLVLRAREAAVAQRIVEIEADRDRELALVERERSRVAREMHDVLAHSLVSIAMLADGTRVAVRADPDEAEDLARTIGDVARESVADVRRLLAELRHEQSEGSAPTLAELPDLVRRYEGMGLNVDLRERGERAPLTPGASLAAYRVLQECLTNALRHGDVRRPVVVDLEWATGALRLRVRNQVRVDARGAGDEVGATSGAAGSGAVPAGAVPAGAVPAGGHGLIGIRERVLLEAGTIDIRRDGSSFVVEASLPTGWQDALPGSTHMPGASHVPGASMAAPSPRPSTAPTGQTVAPTTDSTTHQGGHA